MRSSTLKSKDIITNALICDFKDKTTYINAMNINIPGVGNIPVIMNPSTNTNRDTGLESVIFRLQLFKL